MIISCLSDCPRARLKPVQDSNTYVVLLDRACTGRSSCSNVSGGGEPTRCHRCFILHQYEHVAHIAAEKERRAIVGTAVVELLSGQSFHDVGSRAFKFYRVHSTGNSVWEVQTMQPYSNVRTTKTHSKRAFSGNHSRTRITEATNGSRRYESTDASS
jgi:hypothetical protein